MTSHITERRHIRDSDNCSNRTSRPVNCRAACGRWPTGARTHARPAHPADFAAVAVAALTEDTHAGQIYHLTGPQSLRHIEQIPLIGAALGRALRYQQLDVAAARQAISPHAPADVLFATWE